MKLAAIARKEVRDLWREKTLLVAIVVQLFVAGFSTFLLVGLQAVTDPDASQSSPDMDVAYVGPGGFDRVLQGEVDQVFRTDLGDAMERWREGRADVVVQEVEEADGVRTITLLLAEGDPVATLYVAHLKGLLQEYEQTLREENAGRLSIEPLELDARPGVPQISFAYATLLPLLVLVPVFLSGSIAGDTFSQEIQDRTMLLLRAAPLSPATIVLGKLLVAVVLAPLQVALWCALFAWNGVYVEALPTLLLFATALAATLAAVGMVIAMMVRQEGMTQAAYAAVAIALGALSLALPTDPLNTIARLGVGAIDADVLWSVLIVGATAIASTAGAVALATRAVART